MRWLCRAVVAAALPLTAGCSPELLVGGAIAGSVLYAHANKDNLPRRRPPLSGTPRVYASGRSASHTYTASRPPVRAATAQPRDEPVPTSPVMRGALAYQQLQWDEAVTILSEAIDSGECTESERAQAHVLLGAIAYQHGNAETAREHFVAAHRLDADLQPSPDLFPPPLIDFYNAVGRQTSARRRR